MSERTIDWGGANSPYETSVDRNDNGRVILAEDTTGATVLLEYDESANGGNGAWLYRGPVEMNGNDVTGVGALDAQSVSTEAADVTGETFIQAELSADITGISSGTYTNVLDTEISDNDAEFNASNQIVPNESTTYFIQGTIALAANSGDGLAARVRNVTDGTTVKPNIFNRNVGTTSNYQFPISAAFDLTSGKAYEIQAANFNSSFDLLGGGNFTNYITVIKSVVHQ